MFKKSDRLNTKSFREWLSSPGYRPTNGCLAAIQFPTNALLLALGDPRVHKVYGTGLGGYFSPGTTDFYELTRAIKDSGRMVEEFMLEGDDVKVTLVFLEKHTHLEFFRISVVFHEKDGVPISVEKKGEVWLSLRERKVKKDGETYILKEQEGRIVSVQYGEDMVGCPAPRVRVGDEVVLLDGGSSVTVKNILEPWTALHGVKILRVKRPSEAGVFGVAFNEIKTSNRP